MGPVGPGADALPRRDRDARRSSRLDRVAGRSVCTPAQRCFDHHPDAACARGARRQFENHAAADGHGARRERHASHLHRACKSAADLCAGLQSRDRVRYAAHRRSALWHRRSGGFGLEQPMGLEQPILAQCLGGTAGLAPAAPLAALSGPSWNAPSRCQARSSGRCAPRSSRRRSSGSPGHPAGAARPARHASGSSGSSSGAA